MEIKTLDFADSPASLQIYFAQNPSARIFCIGNSEILSDEKIGFFCSSKSSGAAILKVFERANLWRKERTTIISGFHSPLEREVLEILLKGKGRIILLILFVGLGEKPQSVHRCIFSSYQVSPLN